MDVQGWVVMGLALVLFGYLLPHLVSSRHQLAQARVEDRFSGTLRMVRTGASTSTRSPGEHHGTRDGRPYLHDPRRRSEAPAVNRPTTPSERAAAEARQLVAARAARAAEISRRKAAARRRLVLTVVLLVASIGGWLGVGLAGASVALGLVPTVLLGTVLVLGRRAAKIAARRNAADRAAMARLHSRTEPGAEGAARGRATAARGATAAGATRVPSTAGATGSGASTTAAGATAAGASPATRGATAATTDHGTATEETAGARATATTAPKADAQPAEATTETLEATTGEGGAAAGADAPTEPATRSGDLPQDAAPSSTDTPEATAPASAEAEQAWTPVPVPAPAYTLKASAPRRDIAPFESPAPEATAAAAEQPVVTSGLAGSPYAPVVETEPVIAEAPAVPASRGLDLDSALARRRAVGA